VLLTVEETMEALKKAGDGRYRAPWRPRRNRPLTQVQTTNDYSVSVKTAPDSASFASQALTIDVLRSCRILHAYRKTRRFQRVLKERMNGLEPSTFCMASRRSTN
jgi:hypothetical protein